MSAARRLDRAQQQRSRALWRLLGKKGKREGIACMTCQCWLSEVLETEAERKALHDEHREACPTLMLTSLDLRRTSAPAPGRHALAAAKGRFPA